MESTREYDIRISAALDMREIQVESQRKINELNATEIADKHESLSMEIRLASAKSINTTSIAVHKAIAPIKIAAYVAATTGVLSSILLIAILLK